MLHCRINTCILQGCINMRKLLCQMLTRLQGTQQSAVEAYVASCFPQSAADIERIILDYERKQQRGGFYL